MGQICFKSHDLTPMHPKVPFTEKPFTNLSTIFYWLISATCRKPRTSTSGYWWFSLGRFDCSLKITWPVINSSALIGGKFISKKKSFPRFTLQSECCTNFNQWEVLWLLNSVRSDLPNENPHWHLVIKRTWLPQKIFHYKSYLPKLIWMSTLLR